VGKRRGIGRSSVLGLALAAALGASGASGQGMRAGPCRADADRLCKDVKPGGGAVARCLKEHEPELTPECRESFAERAKAIRERFGKIEEACAADAQKHCAGVAHGQGRVAQCLEAHEADVSKPCQDALAARQR